MKQTIGFNNKKNSRPIVLKLICSINGTSTLLGLIRAIEKRDKRRRLGDFLAQFGEILFHVVVAAAATHLEHTTRSNIELHALRAIFDYARSGPVVHLVVPSRRMPLLKEVFAHAHARALLVKL